MSFYALSGKTTRSHRAAPANKTAALHPVAKANIAATQGQAAAEATLAATHGKIRLFVILGLVAAGGGAWLYFKKRKAKP